MTRIDTPARNDYRGAVKNTRRSFWFYGGLCLAVLLMLLTVATVFAYRDIKRLGSGPIWHIPSRIYSSETRIVPGTNIDQIDLSARLKRLWYRPVKKVRAPGEFGRAEDGMLLYLHPFDYPGRKTKAQKIKLVLEGRAVKDILLLDPERHLNEISLEPESFAEIFDQGYEDRMVVSLAECPDVLTKAIIATEDRRYFHNWGIDLRSIFRASVVNLKSGKIIEGGSTITQQLVKNLFLTSERTLTRKVKETWMSLVMEIMFTKQEILEMYVNEIYLGQWGNAGIYGFGRAARVYFDKELKDLTLPEAALLAGIIRAPNHYSPYKHPQAALERRNTVLSRMRAEGYIDEQTYQKALKVPLGVAPYVPRTRYAPYFVDYLLASIVDTYPVDDLSRGGYRIFTTLDMNMQLAGEARLAQGLRGLGSASGIDLQGALVMVNSNTGEIKAMVGGKDYSQSQFNRAAQMRRQIGSLVKPFVYYAALKNGYVLSSFLDDSPLTLDTMDGKQWSPSNFDNEYHGRIMLADALINSYNIATVRLGMDVGLARISTEIKNTLPGLRIKENPSLLLGALECSPLQVAVMFSPFANLGQRIEPWALKAIVKDNAVLLKGSGSESAQVFSPDIVYLVDTCLMDVLRFGTGKASRDFGMPDGVCGKTGTTNDMRDSWFVGFTKDVVTVVWVGSDAYRPVNLSGAAGAMPIASMVMAAVVYPMRLSPPSGIVFCDIDPENGKIASALVEKRTLAFIRGTEPTEVSDRIQVPGFVEDIKEGADKVIEWFKSLF